MKNYAITGATGFIGSNLVKYFINKSIKVYIIIRETSDLTILEEYIDKLEVIKYDGTVRSLSEGFHDRDIDAVVHLATKYVAEHDEKDLDSLVQSNITYGLHLLESMKKNNIKKMVNIGTSWDRFTDESYNPVNLYAATKKAFQDLSKFYFEAYNISCLHIKIFDTYGPNDSRKKLLYLFSESQKSKEAIEFSPGAQIVGLTYIDDVLDGIYTALELLMNSERLYKTYYLTPVQWSSLREVASIYSKVSGKYLNINWGARGYRNREVMKPICGENLPDWKAKIALDEGLRKCINEE